MKKIGIVGHGGFGMSLAKAMLLESNIKSEIITPEIVEEAKQLDEMAKSTYPKLKHHQSPCKKHQYKYIKTKNEGLMSGQWVCIYCDRVDQ